MMTESVLIVGCYHSLNSGVMAMAESIIQKNVDKEVYVLSSQRFYTDDVERYGLYENVIVHVPSWRCGNKYKKGFLYLGMLFGYVFDYKTRAIAKKSNVIYDISGDSISSDYGDLNALIQLLPSYALGKESGKLELAPQTVGPFNKWWLKHYVKKLFKVAKTAYLREAKSMTYVQPLGIECGLKPDLANSLCATQVELPFENNYKVLGLGVSSLLERYGMEQNISFFSQIINIAIKLGYKVLLVNHVTFPTSNDLELARAVKEQHFKDNSNVIFVGRNYRASEWKYILSHCNVVISGRMHPVVLALSSGVPSLNLAYNHKSYGVVKEAYYPLGDIVDFKNKTSVLTKVEHILKVQSND